MGFNVIYAKQIVEVKVLKIMEIVLSYFRGIKKGIVIVITQPPPKEAKII